MKCEINANKGALTLLMSLIGCFLMLLMLGACTAIPRDAPTGDAVRDGAFGNIESPGERVPYVVVKLSPSIVNEVNSNLDLSGLANSIGLLKHPDHDNRVSISIGDLVSVTIFEAQAGGLFIPTDAGQRSGNFVQLPTQQVDRNGYISVPYAGSIKVEGLSPSDAGRNIVGKLKGRAIEPQVLVSVNERRGSNVSILGEVNQAGRFPLDPGVMKLSGIIARAGGPKYPDYETDLSLKRGNQIYRSSLSAILRNPKLDQELQGGDVVFLSHNPKFVLVLGATLDPTLTSITRRVAFESEQMSMAEAMAKAGGLNSQRADLRSVFVFRLERKETLRAVGVDVTEFKSQTIPTVYSVDLNIADGMFISNTFQLKTHDLIVASDSPYVDTLKYVTLVNQLLVVPTNAATLAISASK